MEKNSKIHTKIRKKTRVPFSPLLFNAVFQVLARVVRQNKEIKVIQTGKKEVKISLFADAMILFMRDPKAHQESVLRLTNAFIKMVGSKMNIQKSAVFLYTNDKHVENEIEETILFSVASRKEKKIPSNKHNQRKM